MCLQHTYLLVEQCPFCQKSQSAISSKCGLGCCTQCGIWLGSKPGAEELCDDSLLDWQKWTVQTIEELFLASMAFGSLPWHEFPSSVAACIEAVGGTRELGRIAGVPHILFSDWRNRKRTPSLTYLLKMSYALNLSPLQLITVEPERLKKTLRMKRVYQRPPRVGLPAPRSEGDMDSIQVFMQTILEGKVDPLPLRHVAHQLGVGEKFLVGRFPQECAQVTERYQVYRAERAKQKAAQERAEVLQAVLALDNQGTPLSRSQVAALLSNPHILRRPEGKATWHAICRERELES
jgi:transcriptional regulator with XRE-family HTH domain